MTQPEARLQAKIVRALHAHGHAAYRLRPLGLAGWPDIFILGPCPCCGHAGHAYLLEVKRPGQRATKLQEHALAELGAAGAVVGVVTDVAGAVRILDPHAS